MSVSTAPHIDTDRCTSCGLCIDICPDAAIIAEASGVARVIVETCMGCGHCYGICPVRAIQMHGVTMDLGLTSILSIHTGQDAPDPVGIEALVALMCSRRSCRSFKSAPPDLAILKDLVRIGTTAPSGTNCQEWQFVLLPSRNDVIVLGEQVATYYKQLNRKAANPLYRFAARLFAGNQLENYFSRYYASVQRGLSDWYEKGIDRLFHGAPAAIVVVADSSSSCPQEDALLATQNILLAAESMGLATCLIGFVVEAAKRENKISKLLGLAETEQIYSVIACGYSAVCFQRFTGRKTIIPRVVKLSQEHEPTTQQRK